ncbi:hypothetical protein ABBQ38_014083 [Trebouxia sp. C0009 RCD-2024]
MDTKGDSQTEYRSMLTSQDTGSDFAASALADRPETPKAASHDANKGHPPQASYFSRSDHKQAPLPDLPVRSSQTSSNQGTDKPVTFTSNPSLPSTNTKADAKSWVAHSDGRTESINAPPELKSALPAKVEQNLSENSRQTTVNRSPLAKDLAQAAKAGQPVAWVAHKDGRLDDIDSQPKLAEALPAKVSEKLTNPKTKKESGFFSKVLHGAAHVAKFAVLAGLTAVATDKMHKEYVTRKGTHGHKTHGQDGPVKPLSDRGLLGRKV